MPARDRRRHAPRAERRAPPCSPTVRSARSVSSRTPCASGLASHETALVGEIGLRGPPSRRFLRRGGIWIPPGDEARGGRRSFGMIHQCRHHGPAVAARARSAAPEGRIPTKPAILLNAPDRGDTLAHDNGTASGGQLPTRRHARRVECRAPPCSPMVRSATVQAADDEATGTRSRPECPRDWRARLRAPDRRCPRGPGEGQPARSAGWLRCCTKLSNSPCRRTTSRCSSAGFRVSK